MTRRPAAPASLRNGLKWRDGRPRWEPSAASRAAGISGRDLKDRGGAWLGRGDAIAAADLRHGWAAEIRAAASGDDTARQTLGRALEQLTPPTDETHAVRRALIQDLLDRAADIIAVEAPAPVMVAGSGTVAAMVDGYLLDADTGRLHPPIRPATLKAYRVQAGKIKARLGGRRVDGLTRQDMVDFYVWVRAEKSIATAQQVMKVFGVLLIWARYQHPPWIVASPMIRINVETAPGRLVFWPLDEERAYVDWCDANGFEDVADAVTVGCWTGARPSDMVAADLAEFAGRTWRFIPGKTQSHGLEALPGILPQVSARIERRKIEVASGTVRHLNRVPLLWNPERQDRHTVDTLRLRHNKARALAVAAGILPAGHDKRIQDCRDTCVTRLVDAGNELSKIWRWTGHSARDCERILRGHYASLLERGSIEMADRLEAWAAAQHLSLSENA